MSAQSAKVINLEAFRNARNAMHVQEPAPMMSNATMVGWVPVWFVPVFWVGTQPTLN